MNKRWLLLWFGMTALLFTGSRWLPVPEPYVPVYPANFGNRLNIPADNPLTKEGVLLGRMLFYEPLLSANNKISCGSCHQQQRAFTDGKKFSTGIDSIPTERNSMSLANLLWVRHFFWDGRVESLEQQALTPLTALHEMGQPLDISASKLRRNQHYRALFNAAFGNSNITGDQIVHALAQFERTLISANAPYDRYLAGQYQLPPAGERGMQLFMTAPDPGKKIRGANCAHCHGSPKLYMELFHNNGLDSLPLDPGREKLTGLAADRGRFRIPTLRNIALTAPYMHDGRFSTLEEVLDHYSEHIIQSPSLSPVLRNTSNDVNGTSLKLSRSEQKDIIAFLQLLTDSTFINNPQFSNPFN
ncbi:c-type cytochrome [Chitinophaga polysaccharea]|uniref:cytochrome-c peroxidase n=1 Tax=Chitinophaga polysaccharea TaxID=1293035 RepID=UPI0014552207|nr:cytochrome c peroxidase [Chitinophaga polysaccharea]NLR57202.1 c-type cytochrome [Chitinophaga polysaccharea]